jgi:hypothetical protein
MTTMTDSPTTHRNGIAAAKAHAKRIGVYGKAGGWLYRPSGRPICQGWASYTGMLARGGIIRDLDGSRLATVSRTAKGPWDRVARNVFDGKPVALIDTAEITWDPAQAATPADR